MTEIQSEKYVSTPEAAQLLGVAASTLRCRRSVGNELVPSTTFGSAVLYRLADIEAFLRRHP